ncbi:hypothetical protein FZ934_27005 (plasmid) [Rhizobium grahamii]|uniref:Rap1a immunity protein domain-containing protein n=1 Tax=Rhizobium grahamii TaxID=1120045 RepID=A0A5Q0CHS4_9HYPH|nr:MULTISPECIES: Rap1a/Tai family immunity protein [Rhizobium]QFY63859.1 hypothetical protein FZ934_27005 [Rhizobium grahamii]QRM52897.1 hypothetical protein F3Y33_27305 [Rhizobium sp. BG6]
MRIHPLLFLAYLILPPSNSALAANFMTVEQFQALCKSDQQGATNYMAGLLDSRAYLEHRFYESIRSQPTRAASWERLRERLLPEYCIPTSSAAQVTQELCHWLDTHELKSTTSMSAAVNRAFPKKFPCPEE